LDAHPDVVIAHEVNAMKLVTVDGMTRNQLFETLLKNARIQAEQPRGRRATGYSYAVPGQWQGRVRKLHVIGSKAGEKTTARIKRDPAELSAFQRRVRLPLRILHVTRNPYDCIARMSLITKSGVPERSVSGAIDFFSGLADTNDKLIAEGKEPVLTVRHESLISRPQAELRRACEFLGVGADDSYLDACAAIVFAAPQHTRDLIEWTEEELEAVQQVIDRHAFLAGYSWTSVD